jgi:hypothetical protein
MGYGDELLAAGQAQREYERSGRRSIILDCKGRPRPTHPIWQHNPAIIGPDEAFPAGQAINYITNGPGCRPYIVYPFTEHTGWTFNRSFAAREHVAKIYLTADELSIGERARQEYGPYVLVEPWSKHANLRWPWRYWLRLIDSRQDITFVQHTHAGTDYYLEGARLVRTSTFREACGLLSAASVYIRGESGMLHAAAALGVPAVAIWGECMDWDVLGGYSTHVGVGIGQAPCGSYRPCTHCDAVMEGILPTAVSPALDLALNLAPQRSYKSQ